MQPDNIHAIKRGQHSASKGPNIQDPFLNSVRKAGITVSVYLVNGVKLQGRIDAFDQFVIVLKNNTVQMLYKHAISTIVPAQPVNWQQKSGEAPE